jgi:hypothetical protein
MPDCSGASLVRRWHASGSQRGDHGQDGLPFAEWLALTGRARDHVPGPVAAIGAPYRAFLCCLPLKLDGQLASFRRGDHLLDVEKQPLPTLTAVGACASKRPTAGGNIGRRRRADLVAQDFDLRLAMRLLRFGGHGGGSAHREKLASGRWSPRGIPDLVPVLQGLQRARANGARSRISTARSAAMPVTRSSCR